MKKFLPVFILVVVVALGGYLFMNQTPEPVPPAGPEIFLPNFDAAQSAKMGAYINNGFYLINEEFYVGAFSDFLRVSSFHKFEDGKAKKFSKEEGGWTVDHKDIQNASYLNEGPDGAIFFVTGKGEIGRLIPQEEGHSILVTGGVHTLQVVEDKLYYSKGDNSRFFRSNLDGKSEESVLDKDVYYPYVVGNFVLYQDDKDGESIHLYNMAEKLDRKILDGQAYNPNIVGNWVFCIVKDKETGFSQIVGGEFKENGEFEEKVFNLKDGNWYAEMKDFHYVISPRSGSGYGSLNFNGKLVGNYGKENVGTRDAEFFGAIPAWLLHNPDFSINGSLSYPYSSPYGYVLHSSDGNSRYSLFDNVMSFDGFYVEGSEMAEDVEKWKAGANK
ncbi:DUF5050 domain-containing protein [Synergistaceae bacterium OttesenSCG-928-I11]|nr:DUF5050 domain-containing protein [Synergistaceae bacterium OttesenSCG-928-I11]